MPKKLSEIINDYAKKLSIHIDGNITISSFYKTNVKKLKDVLSDFNIDIKKFSKGKSYVFNNPSSDIIDILENCDSRIIKLRRKGKAYTSNDLINDNQSDQHIAEAKAFYTALKNILDKNMVSFDISTFYNEDSDDYDDDMFSEYLLNTDDKALDCYNYIEKLELLQRQKDIYVVLKCITDKIMSIDVEYMYDNTPIYDTLEDFEKKLKNLKHTFKTNFDKAKVELEPKPALDENEIDDIIIKSNFDDPADCEW